MAESVPRGALLFEGFDDEERDNFISIADRRAVPDGHVFLRLGDENSSMFLITVGSVRVERMGSEGTTPLADLSRGQTFGEMSFMDETVANATLTAVGQTEVLEFTRTGLDMLLADYPALYGKMWHNIAIDLKLRLTQTNELVDHYLDLSQVLDENPGFAEQYGRN